MRRFSILLLSALALALGLAAAPVGVLTTVCGGGIKPAVYTDFTQGILPSSLYSYSGPSLRTITDATGAITYAPNNLLTYSSAFNNGVWTASGATSNGTDLTEDSTTGQHYFQYSSFTPTIGNAIYWAKIIPRGRTWAVLQVTGAGPYAWFNVSGAGSVGTVAGGPISTGIVQNLDGSYTCWITVPSSTTSRVQINSASANGVASFAGLNAIALTILSSGFSAVTYDTTPRPGDQVGTTSAAYYGPAFDYAPGWVAGSKPWLRIEGARTNLFLNSGSPATQTITVANGSTYTVSFYGTGTLTLSGALSQTMTGTAGQRTTYTGVAGSTSLTATVSGLSATSYPQVELGAFASSSNATAGSAVARAADSLTAQGALSTALAAGPWAYKWTAESTLATTCVTGSAGAFTWPSYGWMKSLVVYPPGTPTAKVVCK